ncbi:MAG: 30S ribosomal protein S3 [bacterium]
MGQKISIDLFRAFKRKQNVSNNSANPNDLQRSVWYATGKGYSKILLQDIAVRKFLKEKLSFAGIAQIVIRRYFKKTEITLFVSKPGVVIGKSGSSINQLRADLLSKFRLPEDLRIEILEFKDPFSSANIIATELAEALVRNVPYRKLAKGYIEKIRYSGVLGAKIMIKGRLNGGEIARKEEFPFGSIPRHTIDSSIDFSYVPAKTKAGIVAVKVWLYKGDKFKNYTY